MADAQTRRGLPSRPVILQRLFGNCRKGAESVAAEDRCNRYSCTYHDNHSDKVACSKTGRSGYMAQIIQLQ